MLATGGSALKAIEVLQLQGVKEARIILVNLVASPEDITALCSRHPAMKVLCAAIDQGLNKKSFIVPGLGDFGDRYFGTVPTGS